MAQDEQNGQEQPGQDAQPVHPWSAECGRQIKVFREALKLKQADLGRLTGLTDQAISNIECGRVNIPTETLGNIAKALRMTPAQLYGEVHLRELALRTWLANDRPAIIKNLRSVADRMEILSE